MGVIVALLPTPQHVQRLKLAIRDRHDIIVCDDWSAVSRECERAPVRVAVIDLFAEGAANFDQVRRLRYRHPRLALIAYVTPGAERLHDLFDAGRYGFEALLIAGLDDEPRTLLAAIEQAEARSLTGRIRLLLAHVDPVARDATLLAVTRAHQRLSSTAFARLMARPRRSLATVLERAGFPPTQRLLMWGRLIVAGHLLEDTRRSADRVAESLGFPSGSAFRNACQRYVGLAPSEIRAAGGSVCVAEAFLRQLTPQTKAPPDVTTLEPRASNARKSGAVVAPPSETEQPPPRSEPGSPRRPSKPVIKPTPRDVPIWRIGRRRVN